MRVPAAALVLRRADACADGLVFVKCKAISNGPNALIGNRLRS